MERLFCHLINVCTYQISLIFEISIYLKKNRALHHIYHLKMNLGEKTFKCQLKNHFLIS